MKLEIANRKAVRYAILKYHYSRKLPVVSCAFSVFNAAGEWCGVICYSLGATNKIGMPFGLAIGQAIELVRVALNGKQESTSKAVAISLKLVRKLNPLVKIVVSYADTAQDHKGIIYQASNWTYLGVSPGNNVGYIHKVTGKRLHKRSVTKTGFTEHGRKKCTKMSECIIVPGSDKHKYVYALDKQVKALVERMKKPYPKVCADSLKAEHPAFQSGDGVRIDLSAQSAVM